MNTFAIYLRPRASLASSISSETLFGAVCWGIQVLGLADTRRLLTQFNPPRFAFSAAFPARFMAQGAVRFYPRPIFFEAGPAAVARVAEVYHTKANATLRTATLEVSGKAKDLKRLGYLSEAVMTQVAQGQLTAEKLLGDWMNGAKTYVRATNLLMTSSEAATWSRDEHGQLAALSANVAIQHNQIDRLAGATAEGMLFYQSETHFAAGAGLWALGRADTDTLDQIIRPALRYLADTGLGANRTVGKGHFAIEVVNAPTLPDAGQTANGFLTLSRYLPADGEIMAGEPLAYQLKTLRGKRGDQFPRLRTRQMTAPIYRLPIRVFEPGSVFPLTQRREVYGQLAEAIPADDEGGPTFQSGLALPIFVRVPQGG